MCSGAVGLGALWRTGSNDYGEQHQDGCDDKDQASMMAR